MTGGDGRGGTGCTGRASSDEESVSLMIADGWKSVSSDGTFCLLAVGVVGDTLFILLNDDALVMQWYLLV